MQNTRLFNRIINYLKGKDMLLPSVTAEDVGKTVAVDESGAWTLAEGGGGGGGGHMYNVTEDPVTYLISCDATPESLEADFNGGIMPSFIFITENPLFINGYTFRNYMVSGHSYQLEIADSSDSYTLVSHGDTDTFAQEGGGGD